MAKDACTTVLGVCSASQPVHDASTASNEILAALGYDNDWRRDRVRDYML